mmetsp:Transcript_5312/g.5426  ORF Transcript_5312/g.5426 Transcript_5312/m.5426 type:complete len:591 (-) Transcript_5312:37-1809(-)
MDCFKDQWNRLTETYSTKKKEVELNCQDIRNLLWRLREPLSFECFTRKFSLNSTNHWRYPVINAILENEEVLPYVKYIADILAWHSYLFSILPSTTSRDQASIWTLSDVINSIAPENRRQEGQTLMKSFCKAFNNSFHLVQFLYECNPNPFLTIDGKVDLSGGKRGGDDVCMNENSTLNFSLPSSSHGETDATGLCTIKLLMTLQDCHNRIVNALNEIPENELQNNYMIDNDDDDDENINKNKLGPRISNEPLVRPGITPALRAQMNQQQRGENNNNNTNNTNINGNNRINPLNENSSTLRIPITSLRTPTTVVTQRLLIYDREKILMPIVSAATEQITGRIEGFQFHKINHDLREVLLATCSPLALHIFQFQYSGEIRKSGGLRGLGSKTKQIPLSVSILNEIWKELDTQHRLTRLLSLLEGCIAFIVSSGGTGTNFQLNEGDTLLEDYVLGTLLMNPNKWEEIRCPSLAQHVRLHHLQCLYLDLERRNGYDPLFQVALAYRDPIPDNLLSQLRQNLIKIDLSIFTPILREFCTEQLVSATWPSENNLKEFIGYSTEVDLESFDWFELISSELELRHAYELYKLVSNPS